MRGMIGAVVALALPTVATAGEGQAPAPAPAVGKAAPAPSPFLQCDGDTGHVGTGESIGRLLAVTATMGLSELGTRDPDITRRLRGEAGATACDVAIGREGNAPRRARLALARTIHLLEADRNEAALASARAIPTLGQFDTDWGLRHTMGAGAMVLEAQALARLGRVAEAEDAAMRAGVAAGYDSLTLQYVVPYLALTGRMTDDKRRVLATTARLFPLQMLTIADALARTGDLAGASRLVEASTETARSFADPKQEEGDRYLDATMRAIFDVLTGDVARNRTLAAAARARLADRIAAGAVNRGSDIASHVDEWLDFVDVAIALREGRIEAARATFGARGRWLRVPASLRNALLVRLYAAGGVGAGVLATDPAVQQAAEARDDLAALTHAERLPRLYSMGQAYATDSLYRSVANGVWKLGKKPRFLLRRPAKQTGDYDFVSSEGAMGGIAGGEGLLLHAALIAQARGADGFVLGPVQRRLDLLAVRFGTIGTPGFARETTIPAADVVAVLSPHIRQPVERR